jgi:hypothetical protein
MTSVPYHLKILSQEVWPDTRVKDLHLNQRKVPQKKHVERMRLSVKNLKARNLTQGQPS